MSLFELSSTLCRIDERHVYGEIRIQALGRVGDRVHALVFVETRNGIPVISFRKANQ